MRHLYVDIGRVAEVYRREREDIDATDDDKACLEVYNADVVMDGIPLSEVKYRNLLDVIGEPVCSVVYDGIKTKFNFHENVVVEPFVLKPAGHRAIDAKQAPDPHEIAPILTGVVEQLEAEFGVVSWDFSKVNGASIAHGGHITDFEFTYDVVGL